MPKLGVGLNLSVPRIGGGAPSSIPLSTENISVYFSTRPESSLFARSAGNPPSWYGYQGWVGDNIFYISSSSLTFNGGVWTIDYESVVPAGENNDPYIKYIATVTAPSTSVPITGWTVVYSQTFGQPDNASTPTLTAA